VAVIRLTDVRRLDLGYFIRPGEETATGAPRVEPVLAYAVRLGEGWLLFDTGLGEGDADVDAHYRPTRRSLRPVLQAASVPLDDIMVVANCHLHFDHCGANPLFAGRPIVTQAVELAQARSAEFYTLAHLIDFHGVRYEELDGEVELFPDVWVIPTPGHTDGHQSLVVRCSDGTVVLAGQAHDTATDYTANHLAARAARDGADQPRPEPSPWLSRLERFDPARVVFAHDMAVWEPA
jgi:glyoxylase-like metal-dependent hydrolase (beta-lactamase superfamily II)